MEPLPDRNTGGLSQQTVYGKPSCTPPLHWQQKVKIYWIFLPQIHGQNVTRSTTFPASQSDREQPWSSGSWGWRRSQRGPQEAQAQPTPRQLPHLLPHPHHHHHRASPATYPKPQGRNGCRQDPRRIPPPPSSTFPPFLKMVDQNLCKFHPLHMK